MSTDGFGWHFGGDAERIRRLKGAFDDLNYTHRAMSSRLTSRLSNLEGSIERRLNALSAAFDAYVELGDVREELRLLPDWGATRIAVQETLEKLIQDAPTPLIDTERHDHWLAHAMNAVVALAEGGDVATHEARAAQLSDEAPEFIALVSISIGAGESLRGRLASLFDGVTTLDRQQWLLLRATGAGLAGENELLQLGPRITPQLADAGRWRDWLGVIKDNPDGWRTVQALLDGTLEKKPTSQWDEESLAEELQARAGVLAGAGSRREADLLRRARRLRSRIENPEGPSDEAPFEKDIISAVQELLIHPGVPLQAREIILTWIREPVMEILQAWADPAEPEPLSTRHRARFSPPGEGGRVFNISVTRRGADDQDLRTARREIETAEPPGPKNGLFFGLAAGGVVLAVLLFTAGGGWAALGFILIVAAVLLAYQGIMITRRHAGFRLEQAEAVQRINTNVAQLRDKLIEQERERDEAMKRLQEELARITQRARTMQPGYQRADPS